MTTDNRTNEPTEAMILAALNAYGNAGFEIDGYEPTADETSLEMWGERYAIRMRSALEAAARAAQGAAPRAKSVPKSSYINPSLPGMIRNLWKSDPSENSVRTALKLAGDLIQELIDLRAAPVLSSSGVDEEKLAAKLLELMREEAMTFENGSEEWIAESDPVEVLPALARGLSEWLGGGER